MARRPFALPPPGAVLLNGPMSGRVPAEEAFSARLRRLARGSLPRSYHGLGSREAFWGVLRGLGEPRLPITASAQWEGIAEEVAIHANATHGGIELSDDPWPVVRAGALHGSVCAAPIRCDPDQVLSSACAVRSLDPLSVDEYATRHARTRSFETPFATCATQQFNELPLVRLCVPEATKLRQQIAPSKPIPSA